MACRERLTLGACVRATKKKHRIGASVGLAPEAIYTDGNKSIPLEEVATKPPSKNLISRVRHELASRFASAHLKLNSRKEPRAAKIGGGGS